jgi:hypothetical protein
MVCFLKKMESRAAPPPCENGSWVLYKIWNGKNYESLHNKYAFNNNNYGGPKIVSCNEKECLIYIENLNTWIEYKSAIRQNAVYEKEYKRLMFSKSEILEINKLQKVLNKGIYFQCASFGLFAWNQSQNLNYNPLLFLREGLIANDSLELKNKKVFDIYEIGLSCMNEQKSEYKSYFSATKFLDSTFEFTYIKKNDTIKGLLINDSIYDARDMNKSTFFKAQIKNSNNNSFNNEIITVELEKNNQYDTAILVVKNDTIKSRIHIKRMQNEIRDDLKKYSPLNYKYGNANFIYLNNKTYSINNTCSFSIDSIQKTISFKIITDSLYQYKWEYDIQGNCTLTPQFKLGKSSDKLENTFLIELNNTLIKINKMSYGIRYVTFLFNEKPLLQLDAGGLSNYFYRGCYESY